MKKFTLTQRIIIAIFSVVLILGCLKDEIIPEKTKSETSVITTKLDDDNVIYLEDWILHNPSRDGVEINGIYFKFSASFDNYFSNAKRTYRLYNLSQIDSINYKRTSTGSARMINQKTKLAIDIANYDITIYYKSGEEETFNALTDIIPNQTVKIVANTSLLSTANLTESVIFVRDSVTVRTYLPYRGINVNLWTWNIYVKDVNVASKVVLYPETNNSNVWSPQHVF